MGGVDFWGKKLGLELPVLIGKMGGWRRKRVAKAVLAVLFVSLSVAAAAQKGTKEGTVERTEATYLKLDSLLWTQYEADMEAISGDFRWKPEKKDSLKQAAEAVLETALRKNRELAIQYAAVPSGLQRLFMVRLDIPKDTLAAIFGNLPENVKASPYGKYILFHLESEQIKENDAFYDFEAVTDEGDSFCLSSLTGKNILLLYGGLACMGQAGRDYLKELYEKTGREDLEIVVYECVSEKEDLTKVRSAYDFKGWLVSDFLQDGSPVKILYGAQAMPTCFLIDKEGIVRVKMIGLDTNRIEKWMGNEIEN
jgi:peroxiredoxin